MMTYSEFISSDDTEHTLKLVAPPRLSHQQRQLLQLF